MLLDLFLGYLCVCVASAVALIVTCPFLDCEEEPERAPEPDDFGDMWSIDHQFPSDWRV